MLAFRNDRFSPSGTDGSNPVSSSKESANFRSLSGKTRCQIVKNTGDGLLVEFPSVVDAVRCAVERCIAAAVGLGCLGDLDPTELAFDRAQKGRQYDECCFYTGCD
jgi:hypothetical protein